MLIRNHRIPLHGEVLWLQSWLLEAGIETDIEPEDCLVTLQSLATNYDVGGIEKYYDTLALSKDLRDKLAVVYYTRLDDIVSELAGKIGLDKYSASLELGDDLVLFVSITGA